MLWMGGCGSRKKYFNSSEYIPSVIALMLLLSLSQKAWTTFLPVKIIKLNFLPEN